LPLGASRKRMNELQPLGPVKFGQTFAYEDGLKVSVTNAERGTVSSEDIEGSPGHPKVIVTAKITNGTRKNFSTNEVKVT
jgi:hypothetical protein